MSPKAKGLETYVSRTILQCGLLRPHLGDHLLRKVVALELLGVLGSLAGLVEHLARVGSRAHAARRCTRTSADAHADA